MRNRYFAMLAGLMRCAPGAGSTRDRGWSSILCLAANTDGPSRYDRASRAKDPDPLLDLPPVPKAGATLVGGVISKLDRVRDRMVVKPFGGGQLEISFDPRTKFFRGEQVATARDLRLGDRVHVETVNEGSRIFAKQIHFGAETLPGRGPWPNRSLRRR